MSSTLKAALRYDGPNASLVRRSLRLAGVALIPAAFWIVYLLFTTMGNLIGFGGDFASVLGFVIFAVGGMWCIVFVPLLIGSLVLLRRVFQDPEIPLEVKSGTAGIVTVAFVTMLLVIGLWYSQTSRGWR
jgi:hypothetical protein